MNRNLDVSQQKKVYSAYNRFIFLFQFHMDYDAMRLFSAKGRICDNNSSHEETAIQHEWLCQCLPGQCASFHWEVPPDKVNQCKGVFNPLALELDIYSSAHHLCKMLIFYEPRSVTLGNTRNFLPIKWISVKAYLTLWPWSWTFTVQHTIYVKC